MLGRDLRDEVDDGMNIMMSMPNETCFCHGSLRFVRLVLGTWTRKDMSVVKRHNIGLHF